MMFLKKLTLSTTAHAAQITAAHLPDQAPPGTVPRSAFLHISRNPTRCSIDEASESGAHPVAPLSRGRVPTTPTRWSCGVISTCTTPILKNAT